jgi:pyruvate dehydrogenase E2 component (dihydrolipoamide acetyltransferase)
MAVTILMPQLGNTVESTILVRWHKAVGDPIVTGELLCEVETDKATMEVESTATGTLLKLLYKEGDEIPVQVDIAIVGEAGEALPDDLSAAVQPTIVTPQAQITVVGTSQQSVIVSAGVLETDRVKISPRARKLADRKQISVQGITGTGPEGRIIERDVQAALVSAPKMTPLARAMVNAGDYQVPDEGLQGSRRITSKDLIPAAEPAAEPVVPVNIPVPQSSEDVEVITLKGARKVIAARMLASLQTTAQLTLNSSADARAMRALRNQFKALPAEMGLRDVTINDLILYAVSRVLPQFPDLNALFQDQTIQRYKAVHLGMAVDTERGLIVPVIPNAEKRSLKALSDEAHRLAASCLNGTIKPDEMNGGTFSVTNLGSLGIESFTPVLNPPQVAILGVGTIQPKLVETPEGIEFIPHIFLSLTVNHQVVDGAPAARFLQALARYLSQLDLSIVTR